MSKASPAKSGTGQPRPQIEDWLTSSSSTMAASALRSSVIIIEDEDEEGGGGGGEGCFVVLCFFC